MRWESFDSFVQFKFILNSIVLLILILWLLNLQNDQLVHQLNPINFNGMNDDESHN